MDDSTIDTFSRNPFGDVMRKHTNAELLRITTLQREDYQPEAVTAAEEELESRRLSESEMKEAMTHATGIRDEHRYKSDAPLELWQRALFFMFFWTIIPWAIAGTFGIKGYERKYKDAWNAMKSGFLAYLLLLVIAILLTTYT